MTQNQDYCNGRLSPTLDPRLLRCECGEVVKITHTEHRPQTLQKQPSPSIVGVQVALFPLETV
ncbi:MAG: hypothetical protein Greene071421_75 [Parcubacteria group bacterium Greene0714_21]|nr:MAG: hypothetical protein Greene041639_526 [Parcubacteria group bacterium Greene0416_39]TSC97765.1 MAG: hypothetical protein Greene101447_301 [Parcubacteria group bacterium Greene1014_47]TSD04239.1 MAG: hypothetical protein Greene071421_75 [Parcubacteria group bacterium Greene0714_21]